MFFINNSFIGDKPLLPKSYIFRLLDKPLLSNSYIFRLLDKPLLSNSYIFRQLDKPLLSNFYIFRQLDKPLLTEYLKESFLNASQIEDSDVKLKRYCSEKKC